MSVQRDASGRRMVQAEVEVPGTPEEVWRAIATGPGISSWFVPTEIEERVGGRRLRRRDREERRAPVARLARGAVPLKPLTAHPFSRRTTMKTILIAGALTLVPLAATRPLPLEQGSVSTEHEWLQQLVGEWRAEVAGPGGEGDEAPRVEVSESVRAIGKYWIVAEGTSPFGTYLVTLGYDAEAESFVGTWVDSTSSRMWTYSGSLDEAGENLTLESVGPGPDGNPTRYRDVTHLDGPDRKVVRNFIQGEDEEWNQMGETVFHRKE